MKGDQDYRSSTALLAIHLAITYSDALRATLGEENLRAESHTAAVKRLDELLTKGADRSGLKHLEKLVARRGEVAYGRRRLDENAFRSIILESERFAKWAISSGRTLQAENRIDADD